MKLDRRLCLLIPVLWFALGLAQDSESARVPREPVSIVLVRHAEKALDDERDPSLSEAGRERSVALARLLAAGEVTHLFSSEYKRTRSTLEPLATDRKLEVEVIGARQGRQLVERLKGLDPGAFAVVAGHSNTVPAIARALGCDLPNVEDSPGGPMLGENEYDRLFLLTLPPAEAEGVAPKVVELRY